MLEVPSRPPLETLRLDKAKVFLSESKDHPSSILFTQTYSGFMESVQLQQIPSTLEPKAFKNRILVHYISMIRKYTWLSRFHLYCTVYYFLKAYS